MKLFKQSQKIVSMLYAPPGPIQKGIRIMKITAILLLAFCMQVSATVSAQKITLKEQRVSLEQVLDQIHQQSGYNFIYRNDVLTQSHLVTINLKEANLEDALKQCLSDQGLDYEIENKTIIIKEKQTTFIDKVKAVFTQTTVTGKVQDETGQPMVGVTVKVKVTNIATATDQKGSYSLTVPDNNSMITFSFIGFETQELAAKDIPNGSVITLKATQTNLREVVVNKGYYTERQELSTGNVSRVTAKEIGEQPVSDPILALEGRVAGLQISQTSGMPGAYSTIQLRGQNSIITGTSLATVNNPLYIIDGVPYNSGSLTNIDFGGGATGNPKNSIGQSKSPQGLSPFNNLDPGSIESITILKDADATSIYGSRGANGVILITTKKGKAGDTKVDLNVAQGMGQVAKQVNLLNTQQYLEMRHEALKNDGLTPGPTDYDLNGTWDTTRYTNWQKFIIGNTAHYTNAQFSISGGNSNTQFYVGGGYNRQTTVFPGNYSDQKASVHYSLSHISSNQRFSIQLSGEYINDNNNLPDIDPTSLITLPPDAPAIYTNDRRINWQIKDGSPTWVNPLAYTVQNDQSVTNNLISNLNLDYKLIEGLNFSVNLGYNRSELNQTDISPATVNAPPDDTNPNYRALLLNTTIFQTWIIEPKLTYHKKISKGAIDILTGGTFQENKSGSLSDAAVGFASDALIQNPAAASNFILLGNQQALYHYNAIFGRVGLNWEEKYLLNLTARRDGSSRFGPGKQFGNFGAIGAGWVFSRESFIANELPWLSFGKLRASYGTTGTDGISDYQYLSTYSSISSTYQGLTWLSPNNLMNPYLAWQEVKKLEFGMELSFLKDRINFSASYYRNKTGNQLVGYPLPKITGFTSVQYNLPAVIQNKGAEFTINTINTRSSNFSWSSNVNFTISDNKLLAFPGIETSSYKNLYTIGSSLFSKRLFNYTGVDPQTGTYTYSTANTNGIPSSPQDWITSQPITPKYYGGLQNSFRYKQFQLDILLQFVKQLGYKFVNNFASPGAYYYNQPIEVLDRWRIPGDSQKFGKFSTENGADPSGSLYNSNFFLTDASFIRLKNLSLSYLLPTKWQQSLHLKNAKIYCQAQNLFTITGYNGLDPETQTLALPPLRIITLGVQTSF